MKLVTRCYLCRVRKYSPVPQEGTQSVPGMFFMFLVLFGDQRFTRDLSVSVSLNSFGLEPHLRPVHIDAKAKVKAKISFDVFRLFFKSFACCLIFSLSLPLSLLSIGPGWTTNGSFTLYGTGNGNGTRNGNGNGTRNRNRTRNRNGTGSDGLLYYAVYCTLRYGMGQGTRIGTNEFHTHFPIPGNVPCPVPVPDPV